MNHGPVRVLLYLWLVLDSSLGQTFPDSVISSVEQAVRVPRATARGRTNDHQLNQHQTTDLESTFETSTLSLFRLSKVSQCCVQTPDQSCRLNCTVETAKLERLESNCVKVQELYGNCGPKAHHELHQQKVQFINVMETNCGQPLVEPQNDQLWDCLLQTKYFDQVPSLDDNEQDLHKGQSDSIENGLASSRHTARHEPSHEASPNQNNNIHPRNSNNGKVHPNRFGLAALARNNKSIPNHGMNPAKWVCCERAQSDICKQLCYRTLANEWLDTWHHLHQFCLQSQHEEPLRQCMDDAESVCVYGCQANLKFCHYFNNPNGERRRLVNLFRNCNTEADQAAERTYQSWLRQDVIRSNAVGGAELYFQNLTKCQPEMWRALACALHLKPCLPERHNTEICRSNCIQLVDECIDKSRTSAKLDSAVLCDILTNRLANLSLTYSRSPLAHWSTDQVIQESLHSSSCIDLNHFTTTTSTKSPSLVYSASESVASSSEPETIHNACMSSKCRRDQICVRNQDCLWNNCPAYRCVNACTVGKLGQLKVPQETYVTFPAIDAQNVNIRLPENGSSHSTARDNCQHMCYCNSNGQLVECNFYCMNGSKGEMNDNFEQASLDQIDCMATCAGEYSPVCDLQTSQTYYSTCVHECVLRRRRSRSDQNSIVLFAGNNCGKVTAHRKELKIICLSSTTSGEDTKCTVDQGTQLVSLNVDPFADHNEWNQFQIVIRKLENIRHKFDIKKLSMENYTICDNHGIEHLNLRSLYSSSKKNVSFSYFGNCLTYCSLYGPVCGRDGQDYQSECASHSSHVLVDYFASCKPHFVPTCTEGKCPSSDFVHYLPLNRCPFCGSVAHFVYESNYFQYITSPVEEYKLKRSLVQRHKLNVQTMSQQLRNLVTVNQCDLFVHLLTEGFLVALMKPKFYTNQQVALHLHQLCQLELKRIVTLVENRSPLVQMQFPLSLLRYNQTISDKVAELADIQRSDAASLHSKLFSFNFVILLLISLNCIRQSSTTIKLVLQ